LDTVSTAAHLIFYSHDTYGLGHIRRNRKIARALVDCFPGLNATIITGSSLTDRYAAHPRIRFVQLPQVEKQPDGTYRAKDPTQTYKQAIRERSAILRHCVETTPANVFISDKEPLGLDGELKSALNYLKRTDTELVLGLRDVLDDPQTVRQEWQRKGIYDAIDGLYDQIWVYGAKDFYDPLDGIGLPNSVRGSGNYTGFLYQPFPDSQTAPLRDIPPGYLLVTAGGGADGDFLMNAVLNAYEHDSSLPRPVVLLLGPFTKLEKSQAIRNRAAAISGVTVIGFDTEPEALIRQSRVVVGMCGYNTFCEVIAQRKPALFVPRQTPRAEQLIRAERASRLGYSDLILASEAADGARMAAAIRALVRQPAIRAVLDGFDSNGLERICHNVRQTFERQGAIPPDGGPGGSMTGAIATILKGYPRLSETFIAQELLELERAGFRLHIISLRHPTDRARHPIHDEIAADVSYLPEYLHDEPLRVLRAWWACRRKPGYRKMVRRFLSDLRRDRTRNRLRRFGQALVLAHEMPADTCWLYAHFIHTPASVAYYAHMITGLDWSCSAHAKDIWTSPDWELSEKLDDARWTVTCTQSGHDHLTALAAPSSTVRLVHHGIDLQRFPAFHRPPSTRDGSRAGDPVRLLTVGRAVEKKGLDTLIEVLATLPETLHWRWTHIGGGVLSDRLRALVKERGLTGRVDMFGSRPQTFILQHYRDSDLFVLPCRIAPDGDRDGLPNVLVEAQSQGLACISSPISGIVELIEHDVNGLLTPPDDLHALERAMRSLIEDPARRDRMGAAGASKVRKHFNHLSEINGIITLFEREGVRPHHVEAAQ